MPSVGAEKVEQSYNSCRSGQFQSSGSQNITHIHSNTDNKDQCVYRENTSPEPDCRKSDNSDPNLSVVQSFNPSESEKHVPGIFSDMLSENKSYNTSDNNSETTSQAFSQHMNLQKPIMIAVNSQI